MIAAILLAASFLVTEGPEWTPVKPGKDPVSGSALDFSGIGLQKGPCGKYGRVVVRNGHFEFERLPGVVQRFFGGNVGSDAPYPESDEEAANLAARFCRLGYNSVRIHHHDAKAVEGSADGVTLNETAMSKMDSFVAAMSKRGIYITTDLMVSRNPEWRALGVDRDGKVGRHLYKFMILFDEGAYADYTHFVSNFLSHVNVKTRRAYKDDPCIAFISLINEGSPLMNAKRWLSLREKEPVKAAWGKWLRGRRAANPSFGRGLDPDMPPKSVFNGSSGAAINLFVAETEAAFIRRMRAFLKSMGARALITNNNCSRHDAPHLKTAALYDYVDDHYYFNHPQFMGKEWESPSKVDNSDFVSHPNAGMTLMAFRRLEGKPLTVSEYNYCSPARHRSFGPILAASMAARQGWGALWRFNYAQRRSDWMSEGGSPDPFCVARDPLAQAVDRIAALIFLRGDMPELPAKSGIAIEITPDSVVRPEGKGPLPPSPPWNSIAWNARVGNVMSKQESTCPRVISRPSAESKSLGEKLVRETPAAPGFVHDPEKGFVGVFCQRTAALFSRGGNADAGDLHAEVSGEPATVAVASLDGKPLASSSRILAVHVTDVQGSRASYTDSSRSLVKKWSGSPMARKGKAKVSLQLASPSAFEVWSLDTSGRRLATIPAVARGKRLEFELSVDGPDGARIYYEIARKGKGGK